MISRVLPRGCGARPTVRERREGPEVLESVLAVRVLPPGGQNRDTLLERTSVRGRIGFVRDPRECEWDVATARCEA